MGDQEAGLEVEKEGQTQQGERGTEMSARLRDRAGAQCGETGILEGRLSPWGDGEADGAQDVIGCPA